MLLLLFFFLNVHYLNHSPGRKQNPDIWEMCQRNWHVVSTHRATNQGRLSCLFLPTSSLLSTFQITNINTHLTEQNIIDLQHYKARQQCLIWMSQKPFTIKWFIFIDGKVPTWKAFYFIFVTYISKCFVSLIT